MQVVHFFYVGILYTDDVSEINCILLETRIFLVVLITLYEACFQWNYNIH
jgi:hypothetical protein